MIKIHTSKTISGIMNGIVNTFKEKKLNNFGERYLVIVPDNVSLYTELKIIQELNTPGIFNFEVGSFLRIAKKRLTLKNVLTVEGSLMIIKKIIIENQNSLEGFGAFSQSDEFLKEIYLFIEDMRNNCINPDNLLKNIDLISNKIATKLKSMLFIFNSYLQEIQQNYADRVSYKEKLYLNISKDHSMASTRVFIMLYDGFSSLEYDIIKEIENNALSLDIGLIANDGAKNDYIYSECMILNKLKANSVEYKIITHDSEENTIFSHIADNIFSYSKIENKIKINDEIKLIETTCAQNEVEYVAREIGKLIDSGMIYDDITVLLTDLDKYPPYIEAVFESFGIPYSSGVKIKLRDSALFKYLKNISDIHKRNFYLPTVIDFLKNPYSGIDRKSVSLFENYCIRRGFEYLKKEIDDSDNEIIRLKVVEKTKTFDHYTSYISGEKFKKLIEKFLEEDQVLFHIKEYVDDESNSINDRSFVSRSLNEILEILNTISIIFKNVKMQLKEFFDLFLSVAGTIEISSEPSKLSVYIGSVNDYVFEKRAIFILGANEDSFPVKEKASKILTEKELTILEKNNVIFTDRQYESIAHATMVLSAPKDRLYILRNTSDGARSKIYQMLLSLFDGIKIEVPIEDEDILFSEKSLNNKIEDVLYLAYCKENLERLLLKMIKKEKISDPLFLFLFNVSDDVIKQRVTSLINNAKKEDIVPSANELFFSKPYMRVTQAEKFYRCPYEHFLTYAIDVKETKKAELDPRDVGNVVHEALDLFIIKSVDLHGDEVLEFAKEVAKKTLETTSVSYKLSLLKNLGIKKRLERHIIKVCTDLHSFMEKSDFKPQYTEVSIEKNGKINPIEVDGISILGKIDRVDTYLNYASIIDYKTGKIDKIFLNLYYGIAMQPFVYLYTLKLNKNVELAAALYISVKDNFKDKDNVKGDLRYKGEGCLLKNETIINKLDNNLLDESVTQSAILPVRKKNDRIYLESPNILATEEFENSCKFSIKMIENAIADIKGGYIEKKPYSFGDVDICKYCNYKIICGNVEKRALTGKMSQENILKLKKQDIK